MNHVVTPTFLEPFSKIFLAPNSSTLSRKSNGDSLSIHSSPGLTLKHKPKHSHQRTGSEPSILSPKVTVTKGYSRQMVPVSELPKFGKSSI